MPNRTFTDHERQAIEDQHELERFMSSPGGKIVQRILNDSIDWFVKEAGNPEARNSSEFIAGAIQSLSLVYNKIYGCISYGERCRIQAENRAKAEVNSLRGKDGRSPDLLSRRARTRGQSAAN